jgi:hypothetical protein
LLCLLATAGCLRGPRIAPDDLVTPLPKLTNAVQALVLWSDSDASSPASDEALLDRVFADKPELGEAFSGVPVKVWHDARRVVVLVCSPDGRTAWLEDASWTPYVDCRWYMTAPARAPDFSLVPPR